MRIHELAKELNLQSKDVLTRAREMGYDITSASSSLSDSEAATLRNRILGKGTGAKKTAAAPPAAPGYDDGAAKRETTIVRVTPKARDEVRKEEVHRTRKANVKLPTPPKPRAKQSDAEKDVPAEKPAFSSERPARTSAPAPFAAPPVVPKAAPSAVLPAGAKKAPIIIRKEEPKEEAKETPVSAKAGTGEKAAPVRAARPALRKDAPDKAAAPKDIKSAEAGDSSADKGAGSTEKQAAEAGRRAAETEKRAAKPGPEIAKAEGKGKPATGQGAGDTKAAADGAKPSGKPEGAAAKSKEAAAKPEAAGATAGATAGAPDKRAERGAGGRPGRGADPRKRADQTDRKKDSDAKKGPDDRPRAKAGKRSGAAGTEAAGDSKEKKGETGTSKPKKKGHKGKEQKGNDFGDKNRRNQVRDAKRRGPGEDFRGSRRSPILEDSSLEKRPLKSGRRPKLQPKVEQEPAFNPEDLAPGTKIISVPITVAGFAEQIEKTPSETIMALMNLGLMMNVNSNIDETTAMLLGDELGAPVYIAHDEGDIVEDGIEDFDDNPEDLVPRPPVITVMGHVDHGKTSLLDAIRETDVTGGEAGGITQHIGASEVEINGQRIVFLDTPGHEAFTAMRARGAHVTDIAVLVVAADDGVMPQTLESISHAKSAGVPVIVAINKIDKEGAGPDRVKQELSEQNILVEDWGGDTQSVEVSAKTGAGIKDLLEAILLQAEVLELKANPRRLALGTVIEARLDKARGSVATLLVLNGTLEAGQSIVAGQASGRIRAMTDYKGKNIAKAGPATAVEVTGLSEVPQAGDEFNVVREDRIARDIAEGRKLRQRDEIMQRSHGASLDTLFERMGAGEVKDLNIIIKGDVQGSVGALTASLEKLSNEEVKINVVHKGVGTVNESDVMLARTSNAVVIGFNVRPGSSVTALAERDGVEIRTYRVIYDAIGDVEAAMKGMLDPEFRELVIGKIEIRETFKVPGVGTIGGAYVLEGKVQRSAEVRVVRDGIVVHEGRISSLKRFKDDVREVATGYECGIGIENYNDIKESDIIEAFIMEEIARE